MIKISKSFQPLTEQLSELLKTRSWKLSAAESCTGGLLSAVLTDMNGSSQWFERGFVTYSNQAKIDLLKVPNKILQQKGAVSSETALCMAEGAWVQSEAQISVAITGIAGPAGGTQEKPVGTVYIAWAGGLFPPSVQHFQFLGSRQEIREQAVEKALMGLIQRCQLHAVNDSQDTYFFALNPNESVKQALQNEIDNMSEPNQSSERRHQRKLDFVTPTNQVALVPKDKLHLTLVYIGKVPESFIQQLSQKINLETINPFNLVVDKIDYWRSAHLLWFGLKQQPTYLILLVKLLKKYLMTQGFKPEDRTYKPHITIARQCHKNPQQNLNESIHWSINEFYLLKSNKRKNLSYEIIFKWSI